MMKHLFRHILTSMLAATALASCSDDSPVSPAAAPDAEVYFSIDLSLPSTSEGSRSSTKDDGTSSDGTLAASAEECAIKSMVLVFTSADDNSTLLYTLIGESSIKADASDNTRYTASTSLKLSTVTEAIAGKTVNLYVLANPLPGPFGDLIGGSFSPKDAAYTVATLDAVQLKKLGALPMSNAERYTLDGLTDTELAKHLTTSDPLILNDYCSLTTDNSQLTTPSPVLLERCVARVDYKDRDRTDGTDAHTYPLGKSGYTVKVESMQLINISKSMYCLRHTSADGKDDNTVLFGIEKKASGFVMDTDAAIKRTGNGTDIDFLNSEELKLTTDNSPLTTDNYFLWKYIPENTLPSVESQIQGYTTGVKFHARITGAPEGVNLDGTDPITINYRGETVTIEHSAASGNNPAGYYLDYYYFIQHNGNGLDGVMGVMEYGIVRNNVYRLSLLSIDGLPRPYGPEEPDEDPRLTLKVRVKKWGYHKIVFDM